MEDMDIDEFLDIVMALRGEIRQLKLRIRALEIENGAMYDSEDPDDLEAIERADTY
jgi:hypothetical protein